MNSTPDPRFEILKRLHELRLADYSQLGTFPGVPLVDIRAVLKTLVKEGYVDDRRSSRGPFSLTHAGVDYYYTLARLQPPTKPTDKNPDCVPDADAAESCPEKPSDDSLKNKLDIIATVLSIVGALLGILTALGVFL